MALQLSMFLSHLNKNKTPKSKSYIHSKWSNENVHRNIPFLRSFQLNGRIKGLHWNILSLFEGKFSQPADLKRFCLFQVFQIIRNSNHLASVSVLEMRMQLTRERACRQSFLVSGSLEQTNFFRYNDIFYWNILVFLWLRLLWTKSALEPAVSHQPLLSTAVIRVNLAASIIGASLRRCWKQEYKIIKRVDHNHNPLML